MYQFVPTREGPGLATGAVFLLQPVKMMSGNKFKHLLKNCVTMGHNPNSFFCLMNYGQTHSNRFREFSDFF